MKSKATLALASAMLAGAPAVSDAAPPGLTLCVLPASEKKVKDQARRAYGRYAINARLLAKIELSLPCLPSAQAEKRVRKVRAKARREWRERTYWVRKYTRLPVDDQIWAQLIGGCESGNQSRTDTGNGYFGAFQWALSTWHLAGGEGSPVDAEWHEEAVRAVRWRRVAGTMQWPACSIKLGYA